MPRKQPVPPTVLNERDQLILELNAVRTELEPFILKSGIQQTEFNAPVRQLESMTIEQITTHLDCLKTLKAGALKKVLAIWKLRDLQYWENLRLMGQENTREQKLLKGELKALRIAWRQRDDYTKKAKAAETPVEGGVAEDPAGVSARST